MKTLKPLLLLLFAFAALTGCRKNDHEYNRSDDNNRIQPGNAANMVASSLASDADGIVSLVSDVTLSAQSMINASLGCGTIKADSTVRQSTPGSATSYTYLTQNKIVVLCNSNSQPDSAVNTATYNGSFSNNNLTSTNSGSSVFNIGGLLSTVTAYTVNGEYKRNGNYQYNTGTKTATSNNIDIILKSLSVSKPYRRIIGGTATFTVAATNTNSSSSTNSTNGNYSYTGTLTFNNTNYATLTLNGTNYQVNLVNGAVIQQ